MSDLERIVHERYLAALDDDDWYEEDPRLALGVAALPHFIAAFDREPNPKRRARLTRIIWQFRDAAALPTLATALRDPQAEIWKERSTVSSRLAGAHH